MGRRRRGAGIPGTAPSSGSSVSATILARGAGVKPTIVGSHPLPATTAVLKEAVALHRAGRVREALARYEAILAAEPRNAQALQLAGEALSRIGAAGKGIDLLNQSISLDPTSADAHCNLGNALQTSGRFEEAVTAYDRALGLNPRMVQVVVNRGNALVALGRLDEALAGYEEALRHEPKSAEAHCGIGVILMRQRQPKDAIGRLRRAVSLRPDYAEAHTNLGNAHLAAGELEEAVAAYRRSTELRPRSADSWSNLGGGLLASGRNDDAIDAYRRAVELKPGSAAAQYKLGNALLPTGQLSEAIRAFETAIENEPAHIGALTNLAAAYLEAGNATRALDTANACLAHDPTSRRALAFRSVALTEVGEAEAARALVDTDRLVRAESVPPPEGHTASSFNEALAAHVQNHPTLRFAPAGHATRNGSHTGDLLTEPKGPIALLEAIIEAEIGRYLADLPRDASHPYLGHRPTDWRLRVWSVVMAAQGHQIPHIHPSGWVSGIYYPKLPAVVTRESADHQGWLEFGRPLDSFALKQEPAIRLVKPEEGLMLLFPSYFYHRTIPFEATEPRISIAFDALPERLEPVAGDTAPL